MRFDRVRLKNFKCYGEADLSLHRGVTVIHGLNGSGKSSLLEACFFALYGARALEQTLDEIVTIGAEGTMVELWFSHDGYDYRIERELALQGDSAQTTTCVLEHPDGTIEGARDVRAAVVDLLRMDAAAFVNCAYVRQGEVNKLINATPEERQDMIDDLLQLGKLEAYRERASDARVGVGRVRDARQGALEDLDEQIAEKESKDLHDRLNGLKSTLEETAGEIERFEENRQQAQSQLDEATAILEDYEDRRTELETLESDIERLTDEIATAESNRETKAERLNELRERADELRGEVADLLADTDIDASSAGHLDDEIIDARLADLRNAKEAVADQISEQKVEIQKHTDRVKTARERAEELAAEAESNRNEADELEASLSQERSSLDDQRAEIEELDDTIESTRAVFEEAPVDPSDASDEHDAVAEAVTDVREEIAGVTVDLENARESVANVEHLLEEGKCPECGQPVDDSPHVESIDDERDHVDSLEADLEQLHERRDELEAKLERFKHLAERAEDLESLHADRERLEQLVTERESALEDKVERCDALRERAAELDETAQEKQETATDAEADAEEARAAMGKLNGESTHLKEAIDRVQTLAATVDNLTKTTDTIETLREERANLADQNDLRREQLADKRERKVDLAEQVNEDAVEAAREQKRTAENYLEKVEPKLDDLRETRDELQSNIGAVEQEISELEELRDRRNSLTATVDRLVSLYQEAHELQAMYADLRAELRQQNVAKLERMLNETFDLVYGNDAYSHIELDGEYELTVYQKDGEALDPEQLSGGERAIFNLSLRCAIYRLLGEGIEGTAPLPPLILDEPTVFLDAGHVSKLVQLIERMRERGVEQIIVVSHDEELVGAADDLITVRKDPTSNRSSVERAATVDTGRLAAFN